MKFRNISYFWHESRQIGMRRQERIRHKLLFIAPLWTAMKVGFLFAKLPDNPAYRQKAHQKQHILCFGCLTSSLASLTFPTLFPHPPFGGFAPPKETVNSVILASGSAVFKRSSLRQTVLPIYSFSKGFCLHSSSCHQLFTLFFLWLVLKNKSPFSEGIETFSYKWLHWVSNES